MLNKNAQLLVANIDPAETNTTSQQLIDNIVAEQDRELDKATIRQQQCAFDFECEVRGLLSMVWV